MSDAGGRAAAQQLTQAISEVLSAGETACLATLVASPSGQSAAAGTKLLARASGAGTGTFGDSDFDAAVAARAAAFLSSRHEAATVGAEEFAPGLEVWRGARVLFERVEPEPRVVVCGAGHVGASLARLARAIGYGVTLIDDRADFVTRERFPDGGIALVAAVGGWTRAVAAAVGTGRGVAVAVVTRGHNEDEECMRAVLAARPDYVGMIGSRRRTNIVLGRLRELGFADELLRKRALRSRKGALRALRKAIRRSRRAVRKGKVRPGLAGCVGGALGI